MTYHARVAEDGRLALPDDLARAFGLKPGELLSIEFEDGALVLTRKTVVDQPLARLREAMRGYSVDQFLVDRRADWSE